MSATTQYLVIGLSNGKPFANEDFQTYDEASEAVINGEAFDVIQIEWDIASGMFETGRSVINEMHTDNLIGAAEHAAHIRSEHHGWEQV